MRLPALILAASLAVFTLPSLARSQAEVSLYDRSTGRELRVYESQGRHYVAGEPGHEYEIRVRNRGAARLLAVTSVDGLNVLSGDAADPAQSGYVIDARGETRIAGWRKSLADVASFYFTRLPDSYAARTGRPDEVGVIGVAVFREKAPACCWHRDDEQYDHRERSGAPSAETDSRAGATADAAAPQRKAERLGTGHGERIDSAAVQVGFERASEVPDEVITIYYDRRRELVAQGVIPQPRRVARRHPDPFPHSSFVPDP